MALFKRFDRAKRDTRKDANRAAMKAAVESYSFWGEDKSAYDQYRFVMESWSEKPATYDQFKKAFAKAVR